jgi:mitogen-activated protein kinase 1/3
MTAPARNISDLQREISELDPRYELERIIGNGSYGIVMRGRDKLDNNSLVAIKRINKEIFDELILAKRILREIKLLAHFHDANIIGLKNILTPKNPDFDAFFIVMDIMDTDLRAVLRSGQKLSDAHIQFFVYQALRALKVIHTAGVVHRDITPANILVNTNCDLKICDFGLAKEESDDGQDMTDYVTMRWYRAPELVMEHRHYTGKIDVWGIGCILGELFGSKPLCQGKDRVLQLDKIIELVGTPSEEEIEQIGSAAAQRYIKRKTKREPVDFKAKYPHVSDHGIQLLQRMLMFHPDKRISVDDALRHPYLAALYDEADENIEVPLFVFDETAHKRVEDVKRAIFEESVAFHLRHPGSAPLSQKRTDSTVDAAGSEGRSGDSTLSKPERDQGKYEDH